MSDARDQDRQTTLQHLTRQLDRLERAHRRAAQASGESEAAAISTGVEAFDRLLPGGGLAGGLLIECFGAGAGSGAGTLACVLARRFVGADAGEQRDQETGDREQESEGRGEYADDRKIRGRLPSTQYSVLSTPYSVSLLSQVAPNGSIQGSGVQNSSSPARNSATFQTFEPAKLNFGHPTPAFGAVVVIDPDREFYPPAAAGLGLDLDGTIVVRPESRRDVLWALEQSLRCPGVTVTLAWLDRLDGRTSRRLALATQTGGGLGFLLRPAARQREPSSAHVRLLIQPQPPDQGASPAIHHPRSSILEYSASRRLHIHLLRGRKGHVAESIELELCDEPPDPVCLAARLAHPASAGRATGT